MMNAFDDPKTPVDRCLALLSALQKAEIRSELHVFGRGDHGFDLGYGKGHAVSGWLNCFVAWMQDECLLDV
jgi:dienelactone hydrolase